MTDREKKVIEVLRLHMCKSTGEPIQHDSYPEELTIPQGERPCDATWRGPRLTYAIEHTTIDSFSGQRHDDDRFRRLMGRLEKEWSDHPDDWLEIVIDVAAIPSGVNWTTLSSRIRSWLKANVPTLPCNSENLVEIPGIPFKLSILRERLPGHGRVLVARHRPTDISTQRIAVIRESLDKKVGVLQQYKNRGYSTVLLLESSDYVLSSRDIMFEALGTAYRPEPDASIFDDIYIATTGTSPWCIVPFKVGPRILSEPEPSWPTAPGYPLGAN